VTPVAVECGVGVCTHTAGCVCDLFAVVVCGTVTQLSLTVSAGTYWVAYVGSTTRPKCAVMRTPTSSYVGVEGVYGHRVGVGLARLVVRGGAG
jgi:hypothetical protein